MFNREKANNAIFFFENLKHTKGRFYGQNFNLLTWQKDIISDVYGTVKADGFRQYKYIYVEIPKKNGKSELAAAAGLYHTFADKEINGEVYGCAADRSQASIVFDVAVDMIDQSPELKRRTKLQISQKRLTDIITGTRYQVVSAEAYTKHGLNISACIFDELHAQPNRALWDVMTFGAGDAREQPIWWIITTAGLDPNRVSICWEQHDYCQKILKGEIKDPTYYPVIFNYQGDDIYNPENWSKANPSLDVTIKAESVQESADKAKRNKADERNFRQLRLNQWPITKLTTWLDLSLWDSTIGVWNRMDLLGLDCYPGLDLSSTTDLSALALLFPPQGEQLDWRVIFECWIPEDNIETRIREDKIPYDQWAALNWIHLTEGNVIDYTAIEERILELAEIYNFVEFCADMAFAAMLLQRLEHQEINVVSIPQTYLQLTDPMNQTEVLLEGGELTHEDNPVARWCFGNTSIAKNGQGLIKYVKETKGKSVDRTKRIDLVAAWITAMARARFYEGDIDLSAAILSDDWGF